jgi:hypothetical protein
MAPCGRETRSAARARAPGECPRAKARESDLCMDDPPVGSVRRYVPRIASIRIAGLSLRSLQKARVRITL